MRDFGSIIVGLAWVFCGGAVFVLPLLLEREQFAFDFVYYACFILGPIAFVVGVIRIRLR